MSIIWKLLTNGKLPVASVDSEGNTPLHLAAAGGHLLAVKTFLSEGVDVHFKNAYGNAALQVRRVAPQARRAHTVARLREALASHRLST